VLTSWLRSSQGISIGVLSALGLFYLARIGDRLVARKSEFYLSALLALVLGFYLAIPYPTFHQYFILMMPFLAILASIGFCGFAYEVLRVRRPALWVAAFLALFSIAAVKWCYLTVVQGHYMWPLYDRIAAEINRVSKKDEPLYAWEPVYFASDRLPPAGMENYYGTLLNISGERAARLHVISQKQVEQMLAAGYFSVVVTWPTDSRIQSLKLRRLYSQKNEILQMDPRGVYRTFWILWGRTK
jgi:hypothetical protein